VVCYGNLQEQSHCHRTIECAREERAASLTGNLQISSTVVNSQFHGSRPFLLLPRAASSSDLAYASREHQRPSPILPVFLRPCPSSDSKDEASGPIQHPHSAAPPSCQRRRFHCFKSYPFVLRLWLEVVIARFSCGCCDNSAYSMYLQPVSGMSSSSHAENAKVLPVALLSLEIIQPSELIHHLCTQKLRIISILTITTKYPSLFPLQLLTLLLLPLVSDLPCEISIKPVFCGKIVLAWKSTS